MVRGNDPDEEYAGRPSKDRNLNASQRLEEKSKVLTRNDFNLKKTNCVMALY